MKKAIRKWYSNWFDNHSTIVTVDDNDINNVLATIKHVGLGIFLVFTGDKENTMDVVFVTTKKKLSKFKIELTTKNIKFYEIM